MMTVDKKSLGEIKPDTRAEKSYLMLLNSLSEEDRTIVLRIAAEADRIALAASVATGIASSIDVD